MPATDFYPIEMSPPEELRTDRLWLRPLRATDVEFDYEVGRFVERAGHLTTLR